MHLGSVDNKLGYCQSAPSAKKRPGVKADAHKANFCFVQLRNMTDRLLTHLKFAVCGPKHTQTCLQCSPTNVGLTQAHPN